MSNPNESGPAGPPSDSAGLLDPRDRRPATRRALCAWLSFQTRFAFDPMAGRAALAEAGGPAAALAVVGERPLPEPIWRRRLGDLARARARALPLGAAAYPARLERLADAPCLLWLRGDAAVLSAPAVAVVGARAPTVYGRRVAKELAAALAAAGRVVVSGLARGVDGVAHAAALEAGGRSIAVLGCGIDRVYPPEHGRLAQAVADAGAVVSEFAPGAPPRGVHFPLRNRLISGLVTAVVVVEARERSGSLVTARLALDQGIDVFAVPGPITAATSRGSNRLLWQGAAPALGAAELLADLGCPPAAAPAVAAELPEAARSLWRALGERALSRDELARQLGCAPQDLAAALLELELAGCVAEDRDGRLRALARPPAPQ